MLNVVAYSSSSDANGPARPNSPVNSNFTTATDIPVNKNIHQCDPGWGSSTKTQRSLAVSPLRSYNYKNEPPTSYTLFMIAWTCLLVAWHSVDICYQRSHYLYIYILIWMLVLWEEVITNWAKSNAPSHKASVEFVCVFNRIVWMVILLTISPLAYI